jgi:hypothetical protein
METNYRISIPKPYTENWDKMSPNDNDRFCMRCSKTAVDFTSMFSDKIQHSFIKNQNEKICRKIRKSQLDPIIQIPRIIINTQTYYHKMFLLVLFITVGTSLFSCQDIDRSKQKPNKSLKQTVPSVPAINYDAVFQPSSLDIMPVPKDGLKNLYNFIYTNYVIPDGAEEYAGKVKISFIIEKDGSLSTFKIQRDFGFGTGMEAIRVLKLVPKWIPGKLDEHSVRTSYTLPISIGH